MEKTRPETRNEPSPHGSEMHLRIDTRKKQGKRRFFRGGCREDGWVEGFSGCSTHHCQALELISFMSITSTPPSTLPPPFFKKNSLHSKGGCGKEVRKNTVTFSLMVPLTEAAQQKKTATLLFGLRNRKSIKVLRVVVFFLFICFCSLCLLCFTFIIAVSFTSFAFLDRKGGRKVPEFFGHLWVVGRERGFIRIRFGLKLMVELWRKNAGFIAQ